MIDSLLFIPVLASFFVTLFLIPIWIKRAKKAGIIGKDVHKHNNGEVAESGGITVLAGFALSILIYIAIQTFIFNSQSNFTEILSMLTVIIIVSLIGFIDDVLGWKIGLNKRTRLLLIFFSAIPLMAINAGKSIISLPILGQLDLGILYPLIFIPIGIAGVTTTFNFIAGFNGLEAGQGIILLTALSFVAYFTGNPWIAIIAVSMIGALLAFLIFNFTPAKIFPGDSLTYPVGALIATVSILGNFERVAIFFFIPYIIETGLKLRGGLKKESFGRLQEDNTLGLRYSKIYGLEHLAIYLMQKFKIKPTEKKVVYSIWLFQIVIILLGFLIFREGIFK